MIYFLLQAGPGNLSVKATVVQPLGFIGKRLH